MNVRTLAPIALSIVLLAACSPGGTPGATPVGGATADGTTPAASGDFCVVAQNVLDGQQDVSDAVRAITTNTISGPDMATAEGWAMRQQLATDAIDVTEALIAEYAAGAPLITDPAAAAGWDAMSQFYADSVLAGNQRILEFPDQTSFLTSGDSGTLTSAPVDSAAAVQNYVTDTCGFLIAER